MSETWQDPVEYHLLYAQALHHVVQVGAIRSLLLLSTTSGDDFGKVGNLNTSAIQGTTFMKRLVSSSNALVLSAVTSDTRFHSRIIRHWLKYTF